MTLGGSTGDAIDPLPPQDSRRVRRLSPVLPPPLALIEMAVLLALVLLEYAWEGFPALSRVNPHPYWIAILLLSLQYGTVSGLMAASIAIIGTVLIGMPEPDIEERYFNYLVRVWTQPVLWLLVAMLLGSFRARQIEQREDLLRQTENLRIRGMTLLDHANNLRARCTMLERRVATRDTAGTGQLLAALARLGDAAPGRWAPALALALNAGFPKSQISLYAFDGHAARLILTHDQDATGIEAGAPPHVEIAAGHPLLAAVALAGRAVSVLDPADDAALRGLGVAAVPVFANEPPSAANPSGRRVIGMLKADRLPASQIDTAMTRRLDVIATYLSPVLQQGLVSPVLEGSRPGAAAIDADGTFNVTQNNSTLPLDNTFPTVRKWRLLKWLPRGQGAAPVEETLVSVHLRTTARTDD